MILAKGEALHKGEIVDFIDIPGHAIPGYSGGPVLNSKDEVIAIIGSGSDFVPIKGGDTARILRAYSVDLLRILDQRVRVTTQKDSSSEKGALRLDEAFRK